MHNNNYPTISIIIPAYNRAYLIKRAIASAVNQNFEDFELIIIDDGSTDRTKEIVNSIDDKRIIYIRLDTNKGLPAARNVGIQNSSGNFICFLDSDDEFLTNKLEKQYKKFSDSDSDTGIVCCAYHISYKDSIYATIIPRYRGRIFDDLIKQNRIGLPLIRRECFEHCGYFDETLPSCDDWDMWIRISMKYKIEYINEPLAIVHNHDMQMSVNINNFINAREKLLDKYKKELKSRNEIRSYLLQKLGFLHFLRGERLKCITYYLKSIVASPNHLSNYKTLLISLLSDERHFNRMKRTSIRQYKDLTIYF